MRRRKIDVFFNGQYCYTTERYATCKEAVADAKTRTHILVAGIPCRLESITDQKITASRRENGR